VVPDTQPALPGTERAVHVRRRPGRGHSVLAHRFTRRASCSGAISLPCPRISDRPTRIYDFPTATSSGAIASRVAVAIDNAMLFEAERRTALAFQRSLLARLRARLDGLSRVPLVPPSRSPTRAGHPDQVGGDGTTFIPLAAGPSPGDRRRRRARGRGGDHGPAPRRAARRAQDEKSPADIMRKLDEWVRSRAGRRGRRPATVSCIYLIYDAWSAN